MRVGASSPPCTSTSVPPALPPHTPGAPPAALPARPRTTTRPYSSNARSMSRVRMLRGSKPATNRILLGSALLRRAFSRSRTCTAVQRARGWARAVNSTAPGGAARDASVCSTRGRHSSPARSARPQLPPTHVGVVLGKLGPQAAPPHPKLAAAGRGREEGAWARGRAGGRARGGHRQAQARPSQHCHHHELGHAGTKTTPTGEPGHTRRGRGWRPLRRACPCSTQSRTLGGKDGEGGREACEAQVGGGWGRRGDTVDADATLGWVGGAGRVRRWPGGGALVARALQASRRRVGGTARRRQGGGRRTGGSHSCGARQRRMAAGRWRGRWREGGLFVMGSDGSWQRCQAQTSRRAAGAALSAAVSAAGGCWWTDQDRRTALVLDPLHIAILLKRALQIALRRVVLIVAHVDWGRGGALGRGEGGAAAVGVGRREWLGGAPGALATALALPTAAVRVEEAGQGSARPALCKLPMLRTKASGMPSGVWISPGAVMTTRAARQARRRRGREPGLGACRVQGSAVAAGAYILHQTASQWRRGRAGGARGYQRAGRPQQARQQSKDTSESAVSELHTCMCSVEPSAGHHNAQQSLHAAAVAVARPVAPRAP